MKILMALALLILPFSSVKGQTLSPDLLKSLPVIQGAEPLKLEGWNYVILDFWASWCSPCEATFPFLKEQSQLWKNRKLLWIGINTESDIKQARDFLKRFESDFLHLHDLDHRFSKSFGVDTLPRLYILDSRLEVVFAERGFNPRKQRKIEAKFKELFSKP
jgi:cytochrome c biogenesis protein CcmG/thiol:disulfide interchange protein DsbE